jgi:hypothetical protein
MIRRPDRLAGMMGRAAAPRGALFAALAVAGCGGPLVPTETYETPLLSFKAVLADTAEGADTAQTRVGIVWVDPFALRDDLPQTPSGITVTPAGERTFQVDLFAPPPEGAIHRLPDPDTQQVAVSFAFGEIVLFEDGDGDGTFAISSRDHGSLMFPPDAYNGAADNRAVIYVEKPAKPGALTGNVWRTLSEGPGYRLANINCNNGGPPTVGTLMAGDRVANMKFLGILSHELIVTRPCLSPARPAVDEQP